jgi:transglutaminase-like putative cysteine protease
MEKTSTTTRWWDWASLALLFVLLETVASRLVATTWTPFLYLTQTSTYIAFVVGTALGYSIFSKRLSQWLSALFMALMLPLQWTLAIDQNVSLEEQLTSVAGRLFFSTSDFLARRPVEDPLFFVVIMTIAFWYIGAWAGFTLVREQSYLHAVLPSAIGLLIIQNYDHASPGRLWFLAFFALMALLLLGRLHYLQNRKSWRERRIFLSPDNSLELTSSMAIAAGLIILVAWTVPATVTSWNSAVRTWNKATQPWRTFTEKMETAVSALESPSGGKRGEFFGSELALGSGFPLSDAVMFEVKAPDIPFAQKPPRYYWRGRTYDSFINGQWYTTGTQREEYSPSVVNPFDVAILENPPAHFVFNTGDSSFSLLYSPSEPIWISRAGVTFSQGNEQVRDLVAWHAYPQLKGGETYQVEAILANPNQGQLREAGTSYPDWVANKYLQVPESFSPQIAELAREITAGAETPYDKTIAITDYLRSTIEYSPTIPTPPRNRDKLEWILFDLKKGYCVYYASAEILMLRSIGVPARMAVGFAQGEREGNTYTVRRLHAHAWPEVYFPGVGWVEFEPTGNQPNLNRPLPPRDPSEEELAGPQAGLNVEDSALFAGREQELEEGLDPVLLQEQPNVLVRFAPWIGVLLAAMAVYFGRKYSVQQKFPRILRTTLERSGFEVPRWVLHWETWGGLSQIERAFESINFGLRTLDQMVPVHNTPVERARKLTGLLPNISEQIKLLLDEHQTYLYTSRDANAVLARRAAFDIRKQVIVERLRYFVYGRPLRD